MMTYTALRNFVPFVQLVMMALCWRIWSLSSTKVWSAVITGRQGLIELSGDILCDYCAISARYQLTLYKKIACNCDVKTKLTIYVLTLYGPIVECQLCAHTIRMKHSGCACATDDTIYGRQPEIKTNKKKKLSAIS